MNRKMENLPTLKDHCWKEMPSTIDAKHILYDIIFASGGRENELLARKGGFFNRAIAHVI